MAPAPEDFTETRSMLKKLAMAHGAETAVGRIAHNMLEQTEIMPTYVRPDWAVHETQTLPWMLRRQAKALAIAVAAVSQ